MVVANSGTYLLVYCCLDYIFDIKHFDALSKFSRWLRVLLVTGFLEINLGVKGFHSFFLSPVPPSFRRGVKLYITGLPGTFYGNEIALGLAVTFLPLSPSVGLQTCTFTY